VEHQNNPGSERPARVTGLDWVKEKRIFLGSAAVSAACAGIAVIGQVDYYNSIPLLPKAIVYLFPIGVEAISWVMGAAAAKCVQDDLPSAKYSRRMWAFALFAAAVNIWHGVQHINAAVGTVLGLASVFGPFVWHSYTGMTRVKQSGKTFEELKVAAKTRLHHPILSIRCARIQSLLQCDRKEAWKWALSFNTRQVRRKVAAEMARKLDKAAPPVGTVEPKPTPEKKPVEKPEQPRPQPANPEPAPEKPKLAAVPSLNVDLVEEFGARSAEAIERWMKRLDETGQPPSFNSIDVEMGKPGSKLTRTALDRYARKYGDPLKQQRRGRA